MLDRMHSNAKALRNAGVKRPGRWTGLLRRLFGELACQASPLTTVIYTHPADEELAEGVRDRSRQVLSASPVMSCCLRHHFVV